MPGRQRTKAIHFTREEEGKYKKRRIRFTDLLAFVPTGFVPERELDAIPKAKFVKDGTKIVFHDELGGADDFGHFAILESLGDELDDLLLARAEGAGSVEATSGHGRIRFRLHCELLINRVFGSASSRH
jgi:hypothetical protein